jgi:AcrR family transcriptional regulator
VSRRLAAIFVEIAGSGLAFFVAFESAARMNRALRKRQINYSARKIFNEKGYHAATVEDIIREAGISRGTFYSYYKSKREVFGELLDSLTSALAMNVKRVDISSKAPPVIDQMLENTESILTILINNLDLTKILLREAVGIDPAFDKKLNEFYDSMLALIQLSLKHGQEMGLIRKCNASYMILGSVRQSMEVFLSSQSKRMSADVLGKNLLELLANGLFVNII